MMGSKKAIRAQRQQAGKTDEVLDKRKWQKRKSD